MSHVTVNGRPAYWGELRIPRIGAWDGDFGVARAGDIEIVGAVEIRIGSLVWKGTARRSGENKGVIHVRVVGGAGGLTKALPPKAYQGAPVRLALDDMLREAGETLSPLSDAGVLGVVPPKWNRNAGPAGMALASLLSLSSASWRVLADGTIWVGPETWPASKLSEFAYIEQSPGAGSVEIVAAEPAVYPGETFLERRVSVVTHRLDGHRVRTRILWEEDAKADRLKGSLLAVVRSAFPNLDFYASYPARVIAQNGDGTLELQPDDARLPGLSNVPIRYGVPGVKATIASGARILLGFAGGDPAKPQAELWESASVTKLEIAAAAIEVGGSSQAAVKGDAYASAESTFLDALNTYAGAIKSIADPSGTATTALAAAVTAFKTATSAALSSKVKVG